MSFFSSRASRAWLVVSLCTPVGLLSAAAAEAPVCPTASAPRAPTQLDYVVLASYADAPHLLALSGYGMYAEKRSAVAKKAAPSAAPDETP